MDNGKNNEGYCWNFRHVFAEQSVREWVDSGMFLLSSACVGGYYGMLRGFTPNRQSWLRRWTDHSQLDREDGSHVGNMSVR